MNWNPFLIDQNQPPADAAAQQQGFQYSKPASTFSMPNVNMNQVQANADTGQQPQQAIGGQQGNGVFGQVMSGIAGAANAYTQGSAATNDFSIDGEAGLKGSLQGLQQGGPIMAVVQGIMGQVGTMNKVRKNLNAIDTSYQAYSNDAYGNPVWNGQAVGQFQTTDRAIQAGEKKLKRAWDPATHIGAQLFGLKKKMKKKRMEIQNAIYRGQKQFNDANIASENTQQAQAAYNKSLKEIFNSPTSLPSQYNVF